MGRHEDAEERFRKEIQNEINKYNNPEDGALFDSYVLMFEQIRMMYLAMLKAGFTEDQAMKLLSVSIMASIGGNKNGSGTST